MAHLHDVLDDDPHFKIDSDTREITRTSEKEPILIQNDHNSERFTFDIPKLIDGHDIGLCDVVRVHFLNISAEDPTQTVPGLCEVDDLRVSPDDPSTMVFSWLIPREATTLVGTLSFVVELICKTSDNIVVYSWHTGIYTGGVVSPGIDNTEIVIGQYYDVLNNWVNLIDQAGDRVRTEVLERINLAEKASIDAINEHVEGVKEDLTINVIDILVQEKGYNAHKVMSQASVTTELEAVDSNMNTKLVGVNSEINTLRSEIATVADNADKYEEITLVNPYDLGVYDGSPSDIHGADIICGKTYVVEDKVKESHPNWNSWDFFVGVHLVYMRRDPDYDHSGEYTETTAYHTLEWQPPFDYEDGYPSIRIIDYKIEFRNADGFYLVLRYAVNNILYTVDNKIAGTDHSNSDYIIMTNETRVGIYGYIEGTFTKLYKLSKTQRIQSGYIQNANGISSITKTNTAVIDGAVTHTYTILFDNGTTTTFDVKDGVGVSGMELVDSGDCLDTYKMDFTNGTHKIFEVPNNKIAGNFANILKGTVRDGGYAFVEGVNPLSNSIKVSVAEDYYGISDDAEVTLKIYDKKNLLQISTDYLEPTIIDGVTITNNGDGSFTLNGTVTCVHDEEEGGEGEEWEEEEEEEIPYTYISLFTFLESSPLIVGGTITFSSGNWWVDEGNDPVGMAVTVKNGPFGNIIDKGYLTNTASPNWPISDIYLWAEEGTVFRYVTIRPQLEIGEVSTEYELAEEPRSITTSWRALCEGVELQAITPNSLIVITEIEGCRDVSRIQLVAEYNQDTNAVIGKLFEEIEKLKTTIVELGGTT